MNGFILQFCFAYATGSQTCILYRRLVSPIKYFILFSYTIQFQRIRLLLKPLSSNNLLRNYNEVKVFPHLFSYMFQTVCNKPLRQVKEHRVFKKYTYYTKLNMYQFPKANLKFKIIHYFEYYEFKLFTHKLFTSTNNATL